MEKGFKGEGKKLFDKGVRLYRLGDHRGAIACFDKALHAGSRDPMILYRKAIALSSMGKHKKALACCDKAIKRDGGKNGDFLSRKAIELSHLKRHKEALKFNNMALEINKGDPLILYNMAVDLSALEKHEDALDYCKKALRRIPEDPDILNRAALEAHHIGKSKLAQSYYDRALKARPRDPLIMYNKAVDLSTLGRHEEALKCCEKAAKLEPNNHDINAQLIAELSHLNKHKEAIRYCNKTLRREPDDPDILNLKASELQRLGRNKDALKCLNRALKIRPRDPGLLYNKAVDLIALGLHRDAIECCNMALNEKRNNPEVLSSKALALFHLKDYENALKYCNAALKNATDKQWIRDLMATINFKIGNTQRTVKEIKDDEYKIILPDTNIWLAYHGFNDDQKGGVEKRRKIKKYIDGISNSGQIKILKIVEFEFYGIISRAIADIIAGQTNPGKYNHDLINSFDSIRDKFSGQCTEFGMDYFQIDGNWKDTAKTIDKMLRDIFKEPSNDAKNAREEWAYKQARFLKTKRDVETTPEELLAAPPHFGMIDKAILVAAAVLADMHMKKNIVILTDDCDFVLFYKWIKRDLGVEVFNSEKIVEMNSSQPTKKQKG